MPRFTVVLPLYNQAHYVGDALRSVLCQTFQDFEVIVVNDGSTDDGADVARSMADSRVRVIAQPNQGVSAARNRGIELARGNYIGFLDSDDRWIPTFLERNTRFLERYPSAATVYTNVIADRDGKPRINSSLCPEGIVSDYFRSVLRCHKHLGTPSAVVAKRDSLIEVGGFPRGVKYSEDHDLWMRLAWVGQVGFIAEPLSIYRNNVCGAMSRRAREGMPYPHLAGTYRRWKKEGRIPCSMSNTSSEFVNWTLLGYVCSLANAGDLAAARRVFLRECRPAILAARSYCAAFLLCMIPSLGKRLWRRHLKKADVRARGAPCRQDKGR